MENRTLIKEMSRYQLEDVEQRKKLQFSDIRRISKYIDTSIFHPTKCSIWRGYVTNINNQNKGTYVNFYFRKKKEALHRLLYVNFVGELHSNEYLKFTCENKGKCCNIHHLTKFKYNQESKNDQVQQSQLSSSSSDLSFTVVFS